VVKLQTCGPGNWLSTESAWKSGFIAFLLTKGGDFWHRLIMLKERCLSGVNRCFLGKRSVSQLIVTFW
jgi:hypothetical protein